MDNSNKFVWKDRKRTFLGLPWSFTRYRLSDKKLVIDTGFWSRKEDEIRLYRITDITLKRSLGERLLGLGTIHCCSGDKTSPEFDLKHIKHASEVNDMLSDMIDDARREYRVGLREGLSGFDGYDDHDDDDFDDGSRG